MMQTIFGTWLRPTKFKKEDGEMITIYAYRKDLERLMSLFPFDCFIQLEGNEVKNYLMFEES